MVAVKLVAGAVVPLSRDCDLGKKADTNLGNIWPLDARSEWPPPEFQEASRCRRAAAISWKTDSQSPRCFWRNRRIVGYQGLSLRSRSQRQSGMKGKAT